MSLGLSQMKIFHKADGERQSNVKNNKERSGSHSCFCSKKKKGLIEYEMKQFPDHQQLLEPSHRGSLERIPTAITTLAAISKLKNINSLK